MGHLKSAELRERGVPQDQFGSREGETSGGRWWVWVIVLALIAGGGYWYFHGKGTEAQNAQAGGATGGGQGGGRRGGGGGPGGAMVVPVVVATAQKGDLPVYFNGLGTVTAFNTVTVRSRVDGQIVKINFTEGQMVHQGDSLLEIDPRPFQVQLEQAEGQLAKDQAQLRDVQVDYQRYQLLFKEGVIPKQQVDTQQAQVGQSEGAIKADQAVVDNAKLQLVYAHVTAPISGRIGLRLVDMGNIVHASDATGLLVITQLQPIAVIFSLPQDQLSQVMSKLHGAQLNVEAFDRDDTTKLATGKLLTIDNQIDTTTGTYKLKAVFNNEKSDLFPNQFVNIHLLVDTKRNVTIIPTPAIQRGPQGTYVYVMLPDNTVKIQPVTIVLSASNQVGISNGIQPGDVVVTDGTDKLQDGSKVEPHTATGGTSAQGDASGSQGKQQSTAPYQPQQTQSPNSQQQQPVQPARKGKRQ
ncbi:MAG TPA: MdtA/MuxA family multidrug efflux RND transporter periplasmic adaptor subunit [Candidatus Eisenbacteria bacterium]|jgi:multidrug efflux system membrane fusion protein|nr:MdtA/MuxA family multidrug efflux RND transporter periplasmic adaptor subunit [Candidatus Eisenbacteria bacterium]